MSKKKKKKGRNKDSRRGVQPVNSKPVEIIREYLCVRGPIYGPTGYARMTRNVIDGMHRAGKKFWIDAMPWAVQPTIEVTEEFKEIVNANMVTPEVTKKSSDLLSICLPTDLPSRAIAPNTWNMTIFETTRVPDEWIQVLISPEEQNSRALAIKGLIIPSHGNLESFEAAPQKKVIVPLSMDYEIFSPDGPVADLPGSTDFNILLSYHQNQRKNPDLVIRLINELSYDTTVYVKTFGQGMSTWERRGIIKDIQDKMRSDCNVVILYDMISDQDQAKMYRAMDLVLNMSHGEGWDLPRCEAYSCGTPAVGPLFIGPQDYTIEEFRLITHNLVPCPEIPPFFNSAAKWAELDLIEFIQVIERVRSDKKKYQEYALKQRDHLMKHTGSLADMANSIWNAVMV